MRHNRDQWQRANCEIAVYRVYGCNQSFTDRGADWVIETHSGVEPGDRLRITIGEVPNAIVEAERARMGWANFLLDRTFGGQLTSLNDRELEGAFEDRLRTREKAGSAVRGSHYSTWISLEAVRPHSTVVHAAMRHRWLKAASADAPKLRSFEGQASAFLDVASAYLLPALGPNLRPSATTYRVPTAHLCLPGSTPISFPGFSGSGRATASNAGWGDLPVADIRSAMTRLGHDGAAAKLTRTAARWLWTAMENRDNKFSSFQFAFLGIEVLTHKVGQRLEAATGGPVEEDDQRLRPRFSKAVEHFGSQDSWGDEPLFKRLVGKGDSMTWGHQSEGALRPRGYALSLMRVGGHNMQR